jgi:hypothetical protein
LEAAIHGAINPRALRELAGRETLFSKRASVGCEAKGAPVAGKRLRRRVKMGAGRKG